MRPEVGDGSRFKSALFLVEYSHNMVTKERFNSFPPEKRYFIAASDFTRAASFIKDRNIEMANFEVDLGFSFLNYLFEDDPSLIGKFPTIEQCKECVKKGDYRAVYEMYLELMELGGIPKATVREAEKQFA